MTLSLIILSIISSSKSINQFFNNTYFEVHLRTVASVSSVGSLWVTTAIAYRSTLRCQIVMGRFAFFLKFEIRLFFISGAWIKIKLFPPNVSFCCFLMFSGGYRNGTLVFENNKLLGKKNLSALIGFPFRNISR